MTDKIYNWNTVQLPFCTSINNEEIYTSQPVNNVVNLADFIGKDWIEKYPFCLPAHLNNNSVEGRNKLVSLLHISGAHGNFSLVSNGYDKKRQRLKMVCS